MEKYIRKGRIAIVGHRGASGLVKFENTIEAFQKAIEIGCDAIECDVRKTRDNILIMNHNPDINGFKISEYDYQFLENVCNKIGYHLPTLEESIRFTKGQIMMDIEIKERGYEKEIYNVISNVLTTEEYYIRSFYDDVILKFKEINPSVKTILLLGVGKAENKLKTRLSELFPKKRIIKSKCDYVSPHHKLLVLNYVKRMHKLNKEVISWTVNSTKDLNNCIKCKCDAIITNYPDLAFQLLEEKRH